MGDAGTPSSQGLLDMLAILGAGQEQFPTSDSDRLRHAASLLDNQNRELRRMLTAFGPAAQSLNGTASPAVTGALRRHTRTLDGIGHSATGGGDGDAVRDYARTTEEARMSIYFEGAMTLAQVSWALSTPFTAPLTPLIILRARAAMSALLAGLRTRIAFVLASVAAFEAAQEAAVELLIDLIQIARGHRNSVDWRDVAISGGIGAAGGLIAGGIGMGALHWFTRANPILRDAMVEGLTEVVLGILLIPLAGASGIWAGLVNGLFSGGGESAADRFGHRRTQHGADHGGSPEVETGVPTPPDPSTPLLAPPLAAPPIAAPAPTAPSPVTSASGSAPPSGTGRPTPATATTSPTAHDASASRTSTTSGAPVGSTAGAPAAAGAAQPIATSAGAAGTAAGRQSSGGATVDVPQPDGQAAARQTPTSSPIDDYDHHNEQLAARQGGVSAPMRLPNAGQDFGGQDFGAQGNDTGSFTTDQAAVRALPSLPVQITSADTAALGTATPGDSVAPAPGTAPDATSAPGQASLDPAPAPAGVSPQATATSRAGVSAAVHLADLSEGTMDTFVDRLLTRLGGEVGDGTDQSTSLPRLAMVARAPETRRSDAESIARARRDDFVFTLAKSLTGLGSTPALELASRLIPPVTFEALPPDSPEPSDHVYFKMQPRQPVPADATPVNTATDAPTATPAPNSEQARTTPAPRGPRLRQARPTRTTAEPTTTEPIATTERNPDPTPETTTNPTPRPSRTRTTTPVSGPRRRQDRPTTTTTSRSTEPTTTTQQNPDSTPETTTNPTPRPTRTRTRTTTPVPGPRPRQDRSATTPALDTARPLTTSTQALSTTQFPETTFAVAEVRERFASLVERLDLGPDSTLPLPRVDVVFRPSTTPPDHPKLARARQLLVGELAKALVNRSSDFAPARSMADLMVSPVRVEDLPPDLPRGHFRITTHGVDTAPDPTAEIEVAEASEPTGAIDHRVHLGDNGAALVSVRADRSGDADWIAALLSGEVEMRQEARPGQVGESAPLDLPWRGPSSAPPVFVLVDAATDQASFSVSVDGRPATGLDLFRLLESAGVLHGSDGVAVDRPIVLLLPPPGTALSGAPSAVATAMADDGRTAPLFVTTAGVTLHDGSLVVHGGGPHAITPGTPDVPSLEITVSGSLWRTGPGSPVWRRFVRSASTAVVVAREGGSPGFTIRVRTAEIRSDDRADPEWVRRAARRVRNALNADLAKVLGEGVADVEIAFDMRQDRDFSSITVDLAPAVTSARTTRPVPRFETVTGPEVQARPASAARRPMPTGMAPVAPLFLGGASGAPLDVFSFSHRFLHAPDGQVVGVSLRVSEHGQAVDQSWASSRADHHLSLGVRRADSEGYERTSAPWSSTAAGTPPVFVVLDVSTEPLTFLVRVGDRVLGLTSLEALTLVLHGLGVLDSGREDLTFGDRDLVLVSARVGIPARAGLEIARHLGMLGYRGRVHTSTGPTLLGAQGIVVPAADAFHVHDPAAERLAHLTHHAQRVRHQVRPDAHLSVLREGGSLSIRPEIDEEFDDHLAQAVRTRAARGAGPVVVDLLIDDRLDPAEVDEMDAALRAALSARTAEGSGLEFRTTVTGLGEPRTAEVRVDWAPWPAEEKPAGPTPASRSVIAWTPFDATEEFATTEAELLEIEHGESSDSQGDRSDDRWDEVRKAAETAVGLLPGVRYETEQVVVNQEVLTQGSGTNHLPGEGEVTVAHVHRVEVLEGQWVTAFTATLHVVTDPVEAVGADEVDRFWATLRTAVDTIFNIGYVLPDSSRLYVELRRTDDPGEADHVVGVSRNAVHANTRRFPLEDNSPGRSQTVVLAHEVGHLVLNQPDRYGASALALRRPPSGRNATRFTGLEDRGLYSVKLDPFLTGRSVLKMWAMAQDADPVSVTLDLVEAVRTGRVSPESLSTRPLGPLQAANARPVPARDAAWTPSPTTVRLPPGFRGDVGNAFHHTPSLAPNLDRVQVVAADLLRLSGEDPDHGDKLFDDYRDEVLRDHAVVSTLIEIDQWSTGDHVLRTVVVDVVLAGSLVPVRAAPGEPRTALRPLSPGRVRLVLRSIATALRAGRDPFTDPTSPLHGLDYPADAPLPVRLAVLALVNLAPEPRAAVRRSPAFRALSHRPDVLVEVLFTGSGPATDRSPQDGRRLVEGTRLWAALPNAVAQVALGHWLFDRDDRQRTTSADGVNTPVALDTWSALAAEWTEAGRTYSEENPRTAWSRRALPQDDREFHPLVKWFTAAEDPSSALWARVNDAHVAIVVVDGTPLALVAERHGVDRVFVLRGLHRSTAVVMSPSGFVRWTLRQVRTATVTIDLPVAGRPSEDRWRLDDVPSGLWHAAENRAHIDQAGAVRHLVPATTVLHEDRRFALNAKPRPDDPLGTPTIPPVLIGFRAFDRRLIPAGPHDVLELTIRLHLDAVIGVTAAMVRSIRARIRTGVEQVYNTGYRLPDGTLLRVRVEFPTEETAAHGKITVERDGVQANQFTYPADADRRTLMHEIGHWLGLRDEGHDDRFVLTRQRNHGLFTHAEGNDNPEGLLPRHLLAIQRTASSRRAPHHVTLQDLATATPQPDPVLSADDFPLSRTGKGAQRFVAERMPIDGSDVDASSTQDEPGEPRVYSADDEPTVLSLLIDEEADGDWVAALTSDTLVIKREARSGRALGTLPSVRPWEVMSGEAPVFVLLDVAPDQNSFRVPIGGGAKTLPAADLLAVLVDAGVLHTPDGWVLDRPIVLLPPAPGIRLGGVPTTLATALLDAGRTAPVFVATGGATVRELDLVLHGGGPYPVKPGNDVPEIEIDTAWDGWEAATTSGEWQRFVYAASAAVVANREAGAPVSTIRIRTPFNRSPGHSDHDVLQRRARMVRNTLDVDLVAILGDEFAGVEVAFGVRPDGDATTLVIRVEPSVVGKPTGRPAPGFEIVTGPPLHPPTTTVARPRQPTGAMPAAPTSHPMGSGSVVDSLSVSHRFLHASAGQPLGLSLRAGAEDRENDQRWASLREDHHLSLGVRRPDSPGYARTPAPWASVTPSPMFVLVDVETKPLRFAMRAGNQAVNSASSFLPLFLHGLGALDLRDTGHLTFSHRDIVLVPFGGGVTTDDGVAIARALGEMGYQGRVHAPTRQALLGDHGIVVPTADTYQVHDPARIRTDDLAHQAQRVRQTVRPTADLLVRHSNNSLSFTPQVDDEFGHQLARAVEMRVARGIGPLLAHILVDSRNTPDEIAAVADGVRRTLLDSLTGTGGGVVFRTTVADLPVHRTAQVWVDWTLRSPVAHVANRLTPPRLRDDGVRVPRGARERADLEQAHALFRTGPGDQLDDGRFVLLHEVEEAVALVPGTRYENGIFDVSQTAMPWGAGRRQLSLFTHAVVSHVRRIEVLEGQWVTSVTATAHFATDPGEQVGDHELDRFWKNLHTAVDTIYNVGYRLPDDSQLHVKLYRTDDPGEADHVIDVRRSVVRPDAGLVPLDNDEPSTQRTLAHEIGHLLLDQRDRYPLQASALRRSRPATHGHLTRFTTLEPSGLYGEHLTHLLTQRTLNTVWAMVRLADPRPVPLATLDQVRSGGLNLASPTTRPDGPAPARPTPVRRAEWTPPSRIARLPPGFRADVRATFQDLRSLVPNPDQVQLVAADLLHLSDADVVDDYREEVLRHPSVVDDLAGIDAGFGGDHRLRVLVVDLVLAGTLVPVRAATAAGLPRRALRPLPPGRVRRVLRSIASAVRAGRDPLTDPASPLHGLDYPEDAPLPVRLAVLALVNLAPEPRVAVRRDPVFRALSLRPNVLVEVLFAGSGHSVDTARWLGADLVEAVRLWTALPNVVAQVVVGRWLAGRHEHTSALSELDGIGSAASDAITAGADPDSWNALATKWANVVWVHSRMDPGTGWARPALLPEGGDGRFHPLADWFRADPAAELWQRVNERHVAIVLAGGVPHALVAERRGNRRVFAVRALHSSTVDVMSPGELVQWAIARTSTTAITIDLAFSPRFPENRWRSDDVPKHAWYSGEHRQAITRASFLRDLVPAVTVLHEDRRLRLDSALTGRNRPSADRPVDEPAEPPMLTGFRAFDARRIPEGEFHVLDLTLRLDLVAGAGVTDIAVEELRLRILRAVEEVYNIGYRLPDGDLLSVHVDFDHRKTAHGRITVTSDGAAANQFTYPADADQRTLAHEIGHWLGLRDEDSHGDHVLKQPKKDGLFAAPGNANPLGLLPRHLLAIQRTALSRRAPHHVTAQDLAVATPQADPVLSEDDFPLPRTGKGARPFVAERMPVDDEPGTVGRPDLAAPVTPRVRLHRQDGTLRVVNFTGKGLNKQLADPRLEVVSAPTGSRSRSFRPPWDEESLEPAVFAVFDKMDDRDFRVATDDREHAHLTADQLADTLAGLGIVDLMATRPLVLVAPSPGFDVYGAPRLLAVALAERGAVAPVYAVSGGASIRVDTVDLHNGGWPHRIGPTDDPESVMSTAILLDTPIGDVSATPYWHRFVTDLARTVRGRPAGAPAVVVHVVLTVEDFTGPRWQSAIDLRTALHAGLVAEPGGAVLDVEVSFSRRTGAVPDLARLDVVVPPAEPDEAVAHSLVPLDAPTTYEIAPARIATNTTTDFPSLPHDTVSVRNDRGTAHRGAEAVTHRLLLDHDGTVLGISLRADASARAADQAWAAWHVGHHTSLGVPLAGSDALQRRTPPWTRGPRPEQPLFVLIDVPEGRTDSALCAIDGERVELGLESLPAVLFQNGLLGPRDQRRPTPRAIVLVPFGSAPGVDGVWWLAKQLSRMPYSAPVYAPTTPVRLGWVGIVVPAADAYLVFDAAARFRDAGSTPRHPDLVGADVRFALANDELTRTGQASSRRFGRALREALAVRRAGDHDPLVVHVLVDRTENGPLATTLATRWLERESGGFTSLLAIRTTHTELTAPTKVEVRVEWSLPDKAPHRDFTDWRRPLTGRPDSAWSRLDQPITPGDLIDRAVARVQGTRYAVKRGDAYEVAARGEEHEGADAVFEVRRIEVRPRRWVTVFTVLVHAEPNAGESASDEELANFRNVLGDSVDQVFNNGQRLPDGSQLHVEVEFVDAARADHVVRVGRNVARPAGRLFPLDASSSPDQAAALVHELGHLTGLLGARPDPTSLEMPEPDGRLGPLAAHTAQRPGARDLRRLWVLALNAKPAPVGHAALTTLLGGRAEDSTEAGPELITFPWRPSSMATLPAGFGRAVGAAFADAPRLLPDIGAALVVAGDLERLAEAGVVDDYSEDVLADAEVRSLLRDIDSRTSGDSRLHALVVDVVIAGSLVPVRGILAGEHRPLRLVSPARVRHVLRSVASALRVGRDPFTVPGSALDGLDYRPTAALPARLAVLGLVNLAPPLRAVIRRDHRFRALLADPGKTADALFLPDDGEEAADRTPDVVRLRMSVPTVVALVAVGEHLATGTRWEDDARAGFAEVRQAADGLLADQDTGVDWDVLGRRALHEVTALVLDGASPNDVLQPAGRRQAARFTPLSSWFDEGPETALRLWRRVDDGGPVALRVNGRGWTLAAEHRVGGRAFVLRQPGLSEPLVLWSARLADSLGADSNALVGLPPDTTPRSTWSGLTADLWVPWAGPTPPWFDPDRTVEFVEADLVRGAVPAITVHDETRSAADGVIAFDQRRIGVQSGHVQELTIRLHLVPGEGVTARQVSSVRERIESGVEAHYNTGYVLPDGDTLRVRVEFHEESGAHGVVAVLQETTDDQFRLSATASAPSLAHSIGHWLGVHEGSGDHEPGRLSPPAYGLSSQDTAVGGLRPPHLARLQRVLLGRRTTADIGHAQPAVAPPPADPVLSGDVFPFRREVGLDAGPDGGRDASTATVLPRVVSEDEVSTTYLVSFAPYSLGSQDTFHVVGRRLADIVRSGTAWRGRVLVTGYADTADPDDRRSDARHLARLVRQRLLDDLRDEFAEDESRRPAIEALLGADDRQAVDSALPRPALPLARRITGREQEWSGATIRISTEESPPASTPTRAPLQATLDVDALTDTAHEGHVEAHTRLDALVAAAVHRAGRSATPAPIRVEDVPIAPEDVDGTAMVLGVAVVTAKLHAALIRAGHPTPAVAARRMVLPTPDPGSWRTTRLLFRPEPDSGFGAHVELDRTADAVHVIGFDPLSAELTPVAHAELADVITSLLARRARRPDVELRVRVIGYADDAPDDLYLATALERADAVHAHLAAVIAERVAPMGSEHDPATHFARDDVSVLLGAGHRRRVDVAHARDPEREVDEQLRRSVPRSAVVVLVDTGPPREFPDGDLPIFSDPQFDDGVVVNPTAVTDEFGRPSGMMAGARRALDRMATFLASWELDMAPITTASQTVTVRYLESEPSPLRPGYPLVAVTRAWLVSRVEGLLAASGHPRPADTARLLVRGDEQPARQDRNAVAMVVVNGISTIARHVTTLGVVLRNAPNLALHPGELEGLFAGLPIGATRSWTVVDGRRIGELVTAVDTALNGRALPVRRAARHAVTHAMVFASTVLFDTDAPHDQSPGRTLSVITPDRLFTFLDDLAADLTTHQDLVLTGETALTGLQGLASDAHWSTRALRVSLLNLTAAHRAATLRSPVHGRLLALADCSPALWATTSLAHTTDDASSSPHVHAYAGQWRYALANPAAVIVAAQDLLQEASAKATADPTAPDLVGHLIAMAENLTNTFGTGARPPMTQGWRLHRLVVRTLIAWEATSPERPVSSLALVPGSTPPVDLWTRAGGVTSDEQHLAVRWLLTRGPLVVQDDQQPGSLHLVTAMTVRNTGRLMVVFIDATDPTSYRHAVIAPSQVFGRMVGDARTLDGALVFPRARPAPRTQRAAAPPPNPAVIADPTWASSGETTAVWATRLADRLVTPGAVALRQGVTRVSVTTAYARDHRVVAGTGGVPLSSVGTVNTADIWHVKLNGVRVVEFSLRIWLRPTTGLSEQDLSALWSRLKFGVRQRFNRGSRLPSGQQVLAHVIRAPSMTEAHVVVDVVAAGAPRARASWPVDATDDQLSHLFGQFLGLPYEPDPNAVVADPVLSRARAGLHTSRLTDHFSLLPRHLWALSHFSASAMGRNHGGEQRTPALGPPFPIRPEDDHHFTSLVRVGGWGGTGRVGDPRQGYSIHRVAHEANLSTMSPTGAVRVAELASTIASLLRTPSVHEIHLHYIGYADEVAREVRDQIASSRAQIADSTLTNELRTILGNEWNVLGQRVGPITGRRHAAPWISLRSALAGQVDAFFMGVDIAVKVRSTTTAVFDGSTVDGPPVEVPFDRVDEYGTVESFVTYLRARASMPAGEISHLVEVDYAFDARAEQDLDARHLSALVKTLRSAVANGLTGLTPTAAADRAAAVVRGFARTTSTRTTVAALRVVTVTPVVEYKWAMIESMSRVSPLLAPTPSEMDLGLRGLPPFVSRLAAVFDEPRTSSALRRINAEIRQRDPGLADRVRTTVNEVLGFASKAFPGFANRGTTVFITPAAAVSYLEEIAADLYDVRLPTLPRVRAEHHWSVRAMLVTPFGVPSTVRAGWNPDLDVQHAADGVVPEFLPEGSDVSGALRLAATFPVSAPGDLAVVTLVEFATRVRVPHPLTPTRVATALWRDLLTTTSDERGRAECLTMLARLELGRTELVAELRSGVLTREGSPHLRSAMSMARSAVHLMATQHRNPPGQSITTRVSGVLDSLGLGGIHVPESIGRDGGSTTWTERDGTSREEDGRPDRWRITIDSSHDDGPDHRTVTLHLDEDTAVFTDETP